MIYAEVKLHLFTIKRTKGFISTTGPINLMGLHYQIILKDESMHFFQKWEGDVDNLLALCLTFYLLC